MPVGRVWSASTRADAEGRDTVLVELAKTKAHTCGVFAKAVASGGRELAIELAGRSGSTPSHRAGCLATTLLDLSAHPSSEGSRRPPRAGVVGPGWEQAVRAASSFVEGSALRVAPAELGDQGGAVGAALLFDVD